MPGGWRSGVHALRLTTGGAGDNVPFFLRAETPQAAVAELTRPFACLA